MQATESKTYTLWP